MGNTERKTLNEPLRNITKTFFEEIQNFPTDYLIRTPWSHYWENHRYTEDFSTGNTASKLARKILNLLAVYWVRLCSVYYPSPCSVLTVFLMGKLALASSDWVDADCHVDHLQNQMDITSAVTHAQLYHFSACIPRNTTPITISPSPNVPPSHAHQYKATFYNSSHCS